jgi:transcriptional regulator with XRE-family HTH domain
MITGDQLRMARAALRLTVKETADLAGIDKGTIVRIEAGENAYRLTLNRLQEVLETGSVVFLEPVDGVAGPGVRLRWGVEVQTRVAEKGERDDEAKSGTRKARNADEDAAELAAYWADNPDKWAKLSQSGRQVLSNMMFGSPEAADEAFGNDAR